VSSGATPTARDPATTPDDTEARGLAWLALIAGVSGIATGIVGAAFRVCLNHADALRSGIITWAHQWPLVGWVLPVAIAALLVGLASWLVQHFAPLAAGSGVQHVEAVMRGEVAPAPLIVLPVKFAGADGGRLFDGDDRAVCRGQSAHLRHAARAHGTPRPGGALPAPDRATTVRRLAGSDTLPMPL
jgi:CIC family chloride channel protein